MHPNQKLVLLWHRLLDFLDLEDIGRPVLAIPDRLHTFSPGWNAASAVVGGSPVGNLKPGEQNDQKPNGAPFQNSLPSHRSDEQRSWNGVLEGFRCHSAIVNYNTISHARLFLKNFSRRSYAAEKEPAIATATLTLPMPHEANNPSDTKCDPVSHQPAVRTVRPSPF